MAQWNVEFEHKATGTRRYVYLHAADARSMKRAHLNAAVRNAVKRAKAKLEKQREWRTMAARCVG